MVPTAAVSSVHFFLLAAFAAGASAATFSITNNCGNTVWPAGIPVGGGTQLDPGQTWTVDVPAGTSGRFWGRTGCTFNGGTGHCDTGDCAGALSCTVSGQPPATLAEYTIDGGDNQDYYDISVVDGYNIGMDFSCSTGAALNCGDPSCPDAYQNSTDNTKTHACSDNSNYQLDQGQTWTVDVPAGTSGRFWGRTGCSFNGDGNGHCDSADCAGALSCTVSGQPPATLAEYTIVGGDNQDYYDISLVDGFNLPLDFSCSTGVNLHCGEPGCPDAYLFPTDDTKTHACSANSNYQVTFCA
ncbi:Pathogenesis-related protein 1A/1B [Dichanthelium oligosanthes]|uniref:Pathogenesis-related protein 1A/1B n=1 Tax=Dichanthelium oligosanthes TaxID=888268 RepID=A0A1E5VIP4_9POAL|nr:Pathogenesis-related protein 1A/1B [Dichanthelium oligosanthes]